MRPLLLAAVALLAIGIANIDVAPTETKIVKVQVPAKTRVIERVKVVPERIPLKQPDGYITQHDCSDINKGVSFREIVYRYGWPAGAGSDDSYAGILKFPLVEDHNQLCVIDFFMDKVDSQTVESAV